jgi:hypothetical protein
MDKAQAQALRAPFPPEAIGKLPKAGMMLDYVGHAATTDRLLEVDPEWTWVPAGFTEHGLPVFDASGGLWIRLTVAGVTRYGYGDGPDPKQCISDAIRNAAMRFGVALDLWSKEDLQSSPAAATQGGEPATGADTLGGGEPYREGGSSPSDDIRAAMSNYLSLCEEAGLKPLQTLGKALGRTVKTDDLLHASLADTETAIAYVVASQILASRYLEDA